MSRTRETKYRALVTKLQAIEKTAKYTPVGHYQLYLTDEGVDRDNTVDSGYPEDSAGYWSCMYRQACLAAGMRAESYGFGINEAIGRVIY